MVRNKRFEARISEGISDVGLKGLVGGVMVVGLTGLMIVTMVFLIGGSYCPAIGA